MVPWVAPPFPRQSMKAFCKSDPLLNSLGIPLFYILVTLLYLASWAAAEGRKAPASPSAPRRPCGSVADVCCQLTTRRPRRASIPAVYEKT